MDYILYKTINEVNGNYYIGSHKTKDLEDSYLGSGVLLKKAIEKYGMKNFRKEILYVFDNPSDMFQMEAQLVTEEEVESPNCYNLKRGGEGGWDHANSDKGIKNRYWTFEKWYMAGVKSQINSGLKVEMGRKLAESRKGIEVLKRIYPEGTWKGKTHSEETKQKMSKSQKGKRNGSGNSQFGTRWITNGIEAKKIKKDQEIPEGYRPGRK